MFLGLFSALGIAGNLANDAYHHNRGSRELNQYIAMYGEERGRAEYLYLRGASPELRIEKIAAMGLKVPYSELELSIIRKRVINREVPRYNGSVLERYRKQTGLECYYGMDWKYEE